MPKGLTLRVTKSNTEVHLESSTANGCMELKNDVESVFLKKCILVSRMNNDFQFLSDMWVFAVYEVTLMEALLPMSYHERSLS